MKKTYLTKRNALFSSANFSWGAYALVFAVFVLLMRLLAPDFFWTMFNPALRASDALAENSRALLSIFGDTAKLASQNEKLASENNALANENLSLVKKIESLSKLAPHDTGIVAGVVARPPQSAYDVLVLSAGGEDGIALGMEVFGEGNVPLGVISVVHENFSRATLFSAPDMVTNGWVGKANIPIIIRGAGAGAMNASAPRSAGIAVGDAVFVPGPGMLPLGSVVGIDSGQSSPSVILRIMPALNLFSVAWTSVRDTGVFSP